MTTECLLIMIAVTFYNFFISKKAKGIDDVRWKFTVTTILASITYYLVR
jgi:hypothetical protein